MASSDPQIESANSVNHRHSSGSDVPRRVRLLVQAAEDIADKGWEATLVRAILAGALITLLSYMLSACDTVSARILVSFIVGFFLALGPFDHVVVSALHLVFGIWVRTPSTQMTCGATWACPQWATSRAGCS